MATAIQSRITAPPDLPAARMSAAEPTPSGRLDTKMATSRATLMPSPDASPIPSTACSGMPSRSEPSANGNPAAPPPLRPPIFSTARSARKNVIAPRARPIATLVGLPIRSPSWASSKATLEIKAPAPNANTIPTTPSPQRRASANNAPITSDAAASAPQPNAINTIGSVPPTQDRGETDAGRAAADLRRPPQTERTISEIMHDGLLLRGPVQLDEQARFRRTPSSHLR